MKKELIIFTILIVSAVVFFTLKSRMTSHAPTGSQNVKEVVTGTPVSPDIDNQLSSGIAESQGASEIPLTINSPADRSSVTTPNIIVSGHTVANAEVEVNDVSLRADGQGNFSTSFLLDVGDNVISVIANDANGKYSEKEITVILQEGVQQP